MPFEVSSRRKPATPSMHAKNGVTQESQGLRGYTKQPYLLLKRVLRYQKKKKKGLFKWGCGYSSICYFKKNITDVFPPVASHEKPLFFRRQGYYCQNQFSLFLVDFVKQEDNPSSCVFFFVSHKVVSKAQLYHHKSFSLNSFQKRPLTLKQNSLWLQLTVLFFYCSCLLRGQLTMKLTLSSWETLAVTLIFSTQMFSLKARETESSSSISGLTPQEIFTHTPSSGNPST